MIHLIKHVIGFVLLSVFSINTVLANDDQATLHAIIVVNTTDNSYEISDPKPAWKLSLKRVNKYNF